MFFPLLVYVSFFYNFRLLSYQYVLFIHCWFWWTDGRSKLLIVHHLAIVAVIPVPRELLSICRWLCGNLYSQWQDFLILFVVTVPKWFGSLNNNFNHSETFQFGGRATAQWQYNSCDPKYNLKWYSPAKVVIHACSDHFHFSFAAPFVHFNSRQKWKSIPCSYYWIHMHSKVKQNRMLVMLVLNFSLTS